MNPHHPLLASVFFLALSPVLAADPSSTLLCPAPDPDHLLQVVISTNCRHVAAVIQSDKAIQTLILDGKPIASEPHFHGIALSADAKHLAYAAHKGEAWYVVFDGKKSKDYEELDFAVTEKELARLVLSPDGLRHAFGARAGQQWFLVLDGKETPVASSFRWGAPSPIVFSPDSQHFAYNEFAKGDAWWVLDGQRIPGASGNEFRFSDDSLHWAFIGVTPEERNRKDLSGKIQFTLFTDLKQSPIPPAGKTSLTPQLQLVHADNPAPKSGGQTEIDRIIASPDGQRLALISHESVLGQRMANAVQVQYTFFLTLDGAILPTNHYPATDFAFSPDSKHYAYATSRSDHSLIYSDLTPANAVVEYPGPLLFTPDGRHFLCTGQVGGESKLLLDMHIVPDLQLFSPRVTVKLAEKTPVNTRYSPFSDIPVPMESTPILEWPLDPPPVHFNPDGSLTVISVRAQQLYVTQVKP